MEAFKAKKKSMLRVVDEASDVSWGSRGNRESHPLVIDGRLEVIFSGEVQ